LLTLTCRIDSVPRDFEVSHVDMVHVADARGAAPGSVGSTGDERKRSPPAGASLRRRSFDASPRTHEV